MWVPLTEVPNIPRLIVIRGPSKQHKGRSRIACLLQVKDPAGFTKSWLTSHINNAKSLGKPLIVEEFGKSLDMRSPQTIAEVRDPVFAAVYDALSDSLESDGTFKGKTSSSDNQDPEMQTSCGLAQTHMSYCAPAGCHLLGVCVHFLPLKSPMCMSSICCCYSA